MKLSHSNNNINISRSLSIDTNEPSITQIYNNNYNSNYNSKLDILRTPLLKHNGVMKCYIKRDNNKLFMHVENDRVKSNSLHNNNDSSPLLIAVKQSAFFTAGYDIYQDCEATQHLAKVESGFGRSVFQIIYTAPKVERVGISSPALNNAENGSNGWVSQPPQHSNATGHVQYGSVLPVSKSESTDERPFGIFGSPSSDVTLEELETGSSAENTSRSGVTSTSRSTNSSIGGSAVTVVSSRSNRNNNSPPNSPGRVGLMGSVTYRRPRGDRAVSGPRLMDVKLSIVELEQNNSTWEYELVNKPAEWNPRKGCYALPFHGRATIASTKNFQLVHPSDASSVTLLFGRMGVETFSLDFQWPLSPLQAFAIACSAFEAFK